MRTLVDRVDLFLAQMRRLKAANLTTFLNQDFRRVDIAENLVPLFPRSHMGPSVEVGFAGLAGEHNCHQEFASPPLLILVTPLIDVRDAHDAGKTYTWGTDHFEPYWAWGILTHLPEQITSEFHDALTVECLCAMAQHGKYGSFLSKGADWPQACSRVEACKWFDNGVGLHDNPISRGENHHRFVIHNSCISPSAARIYKSANKS